MKKESILVVDDELVICALLVDALKDKGYRVDYTLSATEGLKAVSKDRYDVIIVDLKMPEMNGIEFLREVKLKEDPDAMVIVITGYGSLESAQHAIRLGAYDYITKPFDTDRIYFTVRRAIASRKLLEKNKSLLQQLEEERNNLEGKVKERVGTAEFVYRIAREISSTLELDLILRNIVDHLTEKLDLERCVLLLVDESSDELFVKYARGLNKEAIRQTRLIKGEKISGWVIEQNELVYLKDVNNDPKFTRRKQEKYYTRSLISIPLVIRNVGVGVININNKKSGKQFTDAEIQLLKQIAAEIPIGIENAKLYKKLQEIYLSTVKALTEAIDAKDHYTKAHSEHVVHYVEAIAEEMGLSLLEKDMLREAAQLHDLGKIGIHDYILTKSEELTPQEWEEIKLHALKGIELLQSLSLRKKVAEIIKQHHERYDGKGYPFGYKAERIELGARIMAVADAYDAMVTTRPFRRAYSKEETVKELNKESGSQFDPRVVKFFLRVLKREQKNYK